MIEVDLDSFEDKPWRKPGEASQFLVVNIFCSSSCVSSFSHVISVHLLLPGNREAGTMCSASAAWLDNQWHLLIEQAMLYVKLGCIYSSNWTSLKGTAIFFFFFLMVYFINSPLPENIALMPIQ